MILLMVFNSTGKEEATQNKEASTSSTIESDFKSYTVPKEIFLLKDNNIRPNGPIDYNLPLSVTFQNETMIFNRGYEVKVNGDWDTTYTDNEQSVLPGVDTDSLVDLATLTFYENRNMTYIVNVNITGDMVNGVVSYEHSNKDFMKLYPQNQIEDVLTGYICKCMRSSTYAYYFIQKYFIFPDGTGFMIAINISSEPNKKINKDSTFRDWNNAFKSEFKFMDNTFLLSKTN
ncbi:hypothetical protein [Enterococcus alishanensis]